MPANFQQIQVDRAEDGRFVKGRSGNPAGKPPGTRNRATMLAEQLFDGEAEALARKALEMALSGDSTAMRLCVARILAPRRDRPVAFALPPIDSAADLHAAMAAVTEAVARGDITPREGAEFAQIVDTFIRAIDATDFERRLSQLEAAYGARA